MTSYEIHTLGISRETTSVSMYIKIQMQLHKEVVHTLNSLISMQQILFFLRHFSHLHALLEPTRLFILWEYSHLHDY